MSAFIVHRVPGRGDYGRRAHAGALLLILAGLLAACGGGGGGGGGTSPPPMVTLSSIAVTAASASIALGTTTQLTATGSYSDGSKKDISSQVTWASATTTVATVSTAGLATSAGVGTSVITATLSGVMGNVTLTVTAATVVSIAVTPTNPSIVLGTTAQLTATGTYSDATKKDISSQATWVSATTTVATISTSGLATSKGVGSSAITATLSGVVGNDTLTVTAPPTLVSIAITPASPTIAPLKMVQFTATGTYSDATTKDLTTSVTWSSTNAAVATIGGTTGLASATTTAGTTMINGTYAGGPVIAPVTLIVSATVYAYATNFGAGTVSQYVISTGGALTALTPATVAAGTSPFSVSVEPTGQYVYVANYKSSTVSQYTIGANGVLAPVGTGSVATGTNPNGVTIDPSNQHAYVVNFGANTVSQYNIGTTGALAPMSTPTVATGPFPASIVVSPNGKYAYVANFACSGIGCTPVQGSVSQYTVAADGSLTPMTPATVNTGSAHSQPNSLIVDPTNAYLYVANAGDSTVSLFTIGASGALTPGSSLATGTFPFFVTIDPSGKYVYVANTGSTAGYTAAGSISQFLIGAGGALSPIGAGSVAAGMGTSSVAVDPTGTYAYATNRGESSLSQYTIGAGGALTPMATPTVAAGLNPTSIATGY
jgi:6-phosphogluconolactonase (cycloisomerase 2 family)